MTESVVRGVIVSLLRGFSIDWQIVGENRTRVVDEVLGHGGQGQGLVEFFVNQGAEVLGDLDGVLGGHASRSPWLQLHRLGIGAEGEEGEPCEDEAAHFDLLGWVDSGIRKMYLGGCV